jgi:hypothetical protein
MTIENSVSQQNEKKMTDLIDECNRLQQVIDALTITIENQKKTIKYLSEKLKKEE